MRMRELVPRIGRGRETAPARRYGEHDPFHEFHREMNRLFDDFLGDFPLAPLRAERGLPTAGFSPRVDVVETDKEIKVSAELPGMDEKDVTVEMSDTDITIRGERKEEKEDKGRNWYTREQTYGVFHRTVPLPTDVQGEKAAATFKKGLLTVTVPKRESKEARRRSIRIETD